MLKSGVSCSWVDVIKASYNFTREKITKINLRLQEIAATDYDMIMQLYKVSTSDSGRARSLPLSKKGYMERIYLWCHI